MADHATSVLVALNVTSAGSATRHNVCASCRDQDATVFVGDIPQGCGHHELQELFSELANVVNIRLIEHKGIAFVTVDSEAEVGHIIDVADSAGLHVHGEMIRVARAHQPSDAPVCSHEVSHITFASHMRRQCFGMSCACRQ